MKITALIPAAGMGKRMNAGINKQYLLLGGKPILAHTLQVFQQAPFVEDIYVIIPFDEIDYCRQTVVEAFGFSKVRGVVAGGKERQNSVMNGLNALQQPAPDDIILVHDGVRPFVPESVLLEAARTAARCDGALTAVPAKDTIKVVEEGAVTATPPRETLWLAQTPQAFRYEILREAYDAAERDGFLGTDDASLVERLGRQIRVVRGDYRNIKITTPEDMILGEAFLSRGGTP